MCAFRKVKECFGFALFLETPHTYHLSGYSNNRYLSFFCWLLSGSKQWSAVYHFQNRIVHKKRCETSYRYVSFAYYPQCIFLRTKLALLLINELTVFIFLLYNMSTSTLLLKVELLAFLYTYAN